MFFKAKIGLVWFYLFLIYSVTFSLDVVLNKSAISGCLIRRAALREPEKELKQNHWMPTSKSMWTAHHVNIGANWFGRMSTRQTGSIVIFFFCLKFKKEKNVSSHLLSPLFKSPFFTLGVVVLVSGMTMCRESRSSHARAFSHCLISIFNFVFLSFLLV